MRGARLGVDVGSVRIGIAISDPDGILATPLKTVARDQTPGDQTPGASGGRKPRHKGGQAVPQPRESAPPPADMSEIANLVHEYSVVEIIVGLPINLAGLEGPAAASIRQYVDGLAKVVDPIPVRVTDERMSTVAAARRLSERGVRGRRQRAVVDQAAAVEILQGWLEARRRPGEPA